MVFQLRKSSCYKPPPGSPAESLPPAVAPPAPAVPPVLMERNYSGLALNPSGSPVKQGDKETRPSSRLGDRDIPPTTSSPSGSPTMWLSWETRPGENAPLRVNHISDLKIDFLESC